MKYIKLYESFIENNNTDKMYWLLPTDERYEHSLLKINCENSGMLSILKRQAYNQKYIFIGYNKKGENRWGWVNYNDKLTCDFYENKGYKFGGTVNIPDYEIIANKYNL